MHILYIDIDSIIEPPWIFLPAHGFSFLQVAPRQSQWNDPCRSPAKHTNTVTHAKGKKHEKNDHL